MNDIVRFSETATAFFRDEKGVVHPITGGDTVDRFGTDDTVQKNPPPVTNPKIREIAQNYVKSVGLPPIHDFEPQTLQPSEGTAIANAYENAADNPNDAETKDAYAQFNKEVQGQWDAIASSGIKVEPWEKEGQPYQNSTDMKNDVYNNNHLYYFKSGGEGNTPTKTMTLEQNDKFRAVHDIFGHAQTGNQFGPVGETNAYLEHSQMFSPKALKALTTETLAQNATYNFGKNNVGKPKEERTFPEQKATILPSSLYSGIFQRRDAKMAALSFNDDDYFLCPHHKRATSDQSKNSSPIGFFTEGGKVHPIESGGHSPEGVEPIAHNSEGHLLEKLKDSGGFTFHTHTGEEPVTGFAISPFEGREQTFNGINVTPVDLHQYMQGNDDLLRKPDHYMGGWNDKEANKSYLDVSIIKQNEQDARQLAIEHKQEAYYDLGKGENVYVYAKHSIISIFLDAADAFTKSSNSEVSLYLKDIVSEFAEGGNVQGFFRDEQGKIHPISKGSSGGGGSGGGGGKPPILDPYNGNLKNTKESREKVDSWLGSLGLSRDKLKENAHALFNAATPDQHERGMAWYKDAHAFAEKLSGISGLPIERTAGMIATTSPNMAWKRNMEVSQKAAEAWGGVSKDKHGNPITSLSISKTASRALVESDKRSKLAGRRNHPLDVEHYHGMEKESWGKDFTGTHDVKELPGDVLAAFHPGLNGYYRSGFANAMHIAKTGDVEKVSKQPKARSFYNNIVDPTEQYHVSHPTIDRHEIQGLSGKGRGGYSGMDEKIASTVFTDPEKYEAFSEAIRDVAKTHGIRNNESQAVTWVVNKEGETEKSRQKRIAKSQHAANTSNTYNDDEDETGYIDLDSLSPEELVQLQQEDIQTQIMAQNEYEKNMYGKRKNSIMDQLISAFEAFKKD